MDNNPKIEPLSIYIHIPFCRRKCGYCDFLSFCDMEDIYEPYVEALCRDIATSAVNFTDYQVVTVFFGGGTPTVLAAAQLGRILEAVKDNYALAEGASISTEANPETVDMEYLVDLRQMGFNRISFGVQSFEDTMLANIDRIHTGEKAIEAVKQAAAAGFDDINIDLIFALPHQSISDFEKSLEIAPSLPITHISCYALTVEEGTPLAQNCKLMGAIPDETADRAMYHMATEKLVAAGFGHYEISNWAKPGRECLHNIGYWTGREYMGFGIGAHSLVKNSRFCKTDNLEEYIGGDFATIHLEDISRREAMAEFVILGLRLIDGIDAHGFKKGFDQDIFGVFGGQIKRFEQEGLLAISGDNIRLTKKGLDLPNLIFSEFL